MTDEADTKKRPVPLWVKALLGLSLALNLAVIGLLGGIATRFHKDAPGPGAVNSAIPYVIALPREDRRALNDQIRQKGRDGDLPKRGARRAQYVQMVSLLESGAWSAAEAKSIMRAQAEDTSRVQVAVEAAWLEVIEGYSDDERKAVAASLRVVLERGPGRRKGGKNK